MNDLDVWVGLWALTSIIGGSIGGLATNRLMKWLDSKRRKGQMSEPDLRDAIWAVLNTPNVSAQEMVLGLRGFLQMTEVNEAGEQ